MKSQTLATANIRIGRRIFFKKKSPADSNHIEHFITFAPIFNL